MQFLSGIIADLRSYKYLHVLEHVQFNIYLILQKVGGIRGCQLAQLSQRSCNLWNIAELHEICGLKQVCHSVSSHLVNDSLHPIEDRVLK